MPIDRAGPRAVPRTREALRRWTVLLLAAWSAGCAMPPLRRHTVEEYEARWGAHGEQRRTYRYLLHLPPGHDDPAAADRLWPLIVYLPGTLSHGVDIRRAATGGPPEQIELGRDIPAVVITITNPRYLEIFNPHVVVGIVDEAIRKYRVDPDRVTVTGLSIGGQGAWDVAKCYPDRIAGIAPVATWAARAGVERMVDVPVWAIHGQLDFAIPPGCQGGAVCALRKAGGHVRYTVIPGRFHWIWEEVYASDRLYAWLLSQDLSARPGRAPRPTPPPPEGTSAPVVAPEPRAPAAPAPVPSALPPPVIRRVPAQNNG